MLRHSSFQERFTNQRHKASDSHCCPVRDMLTNRVGRAAATSTSASLSPALASIQRSSLHHATHTHMKPACLLHYQAQSKPGIRCSRKVHNSNVSFDSRWKKRHRRTLMTYALDAAMPFDFEAREEDRRRAKAREKSRQTIGIIGFGNFGQFLAARFIREGHRVIATSRGDYLEEAERIGVDFFGDVDDFCEEHPEIVVLSTSILSLEKVLDSIPFQRLKRSTLFVDVLSVKEFPRQLMLNKLPTDFDILCTHPMFGPDSGKGRWDGLPFVYEKVRIRESGTRVQRVDLFLDFFRCEGCRMVELTCLEHDRLAASSQFVTHTIGRMLGRLEMRDTTINTKGYESLLTLVENTRNDSFDLFYGLFMYNVNATEELERMEMAFDEVKKELFGRMHTAVRQQLFEDNLKVSSEDATNKETTSHVPK